MKVVEIHSHLNGREFLLVHQKRLWKEVLAVIDDIDAEATKTKVSKEARMAGRVLYSPRALNVEFQSRFKVLGWKETRTQYWVTSNAALIRKTLQLSPADQRAEIQRAGFDPIASYNQTDFVKNKVAVEVQLGKYAFVAYDLFVKHLAFYVGGVIDVGVEILPMKSLQAQMSSGVGYYEGELYNLIREGRGVPGVPLVVVGIAP